MGERGRERDREGERGREREREGERGRERDREGERGREREREEERGREREREGERGIWTCCIISWLCSDNLSTVTKLLFLLVLTCLLCSLVGSM